MKKCNKCSKELDSSFFSIDNSKRDKLRTICRICTSLKKDKTTVQKRVICSEKNKYCYKCNKEKPLLEFANDIKGAKGKSSYCKSCIKNRNRKYNRENKSKISQSRKVYFKNKRKTDLNFRLKCNLRSRLNMALKHKYKKGSAISDLGCSIEDFKLYLESKFQPGMTWDNYGKYGWHIDHIKPLSLFNLEDREEIKLAMHYTNLQPLWAIDNLSKQNKYEEN